MYIVSEDLVKATDPKVRDLCEQFIASHQQLSKDYAGALTIYEQTSIEAAPSVISTVPAAALGPKTSKTKRAMT